ncbi:hypothetical protein FKM82_016928 [Ascaphus truei]
MSNETILLLYSLLQIYRTRTYKDYRNNSKLKKLLKGVKPCVVDRCVVSTIFHCLFACFFILLFSLIVMNVYCIISLLSH